MSLKQAERLETELYRRAMDVDKSKMSDVLLMFALKAKKPEIYREKMTAQLDRCGSNDFVGEM